MDLPFTVEVGLGSLSSVLLVVDPRPFETYKGNLKANSFIRDFNYLYNREPNVKEVRENLVFLGHSRIFDGIFFLLIMERRCFERTNKALIFLLTPLIIFLVDVGVVGIACAFDNI